MFHLFASLALSSVGSVDPAIDSIPLREARLQLEAEDTLAAIDILDEWSSRHKAGQELTDLLGRLHFPDEPVDTLRPAEVPRQLAPNRRWRLRVDGGALVADPLSWDLGATLATQLATLKIGGAPAFLEGGVASVVWSAASEPPLWAIEPLVSLSVQAGAWDVRLQAWGGLFDEELDAGFMTTGSITQGDSGRVRRRLGGTARWSLVSSSLAGVFAQWDDAFGKWTWEARSDVRLRYDPVEGVDSHNSDSLLLRSTRLQSLCRAVVLRRIGKWGFGPAVELDLRTSLASDEWVGSAGSLQRQVRKDVSFSGGAVARRVVRNGRWLELRMGFSGAAMDSDIDPTYAERNTGPTVSFASGLSF